MNKFFSTAIIFSFVAIPVFGQDDPLRDKLLEEQAETYKSEAQDRAEYYKATNPKRNHDQPDFFEKSHPIKPNPIPSNPIE